MSKTRGPMTWKKWTPKEDARLKSLVGEGKPVREIAKILQRTEYSVNNRMGVLRIYKHRKFTSRNPVLVAELIKFRMLGWKVDDIARVYGVRATNVSRILCRKGFKGKWTKPQPKNHTNYRYWSEVELALLRKLLKKKYSTERIHREMPHRSLRVVQYQARKMTQYWLSDEEQAERKRLRKKEKQWRIW